VWIHENAAETGALLPARRGRPSATYSTISPCVAPREWAAVVVGCILQIFGVPERALPRDAQDLPCKDRGDGGHLLVNRLRRLGIPLVFVLATAAAAGFAGTLVPLRRRIGELQGTLPPRFEFFASASTTLKPLQHKDSRVVRFSG